jgi:predicted helicase
MRKHLLESFDKIYILDLHGNAKKKEVCPDGSPDQNVFDIMQGVSINIFVKTGVKKKNELGVIHQYDLQGKRDFKYDFLTNHELKTIEWEILDYQIPDYFFIPKDNSVKIIYDKGYSINDIFGKTSSGVQTEFDELVTHQTRIKAENTLNDLLSLPISEFILKYGFQSKQKKIEIAINDVRTQKPSIQVIDYKIFNKQYCIYTGKTNGIMGRPRFEMMKNIISKDNLSICLLRSLIDTTNFSSIFLSKNLVDKNLYGFQTSLFPLYLYIETNTQHTAFDTNERIPNLNMEIVNQIATGLGLTFTNEKVETPNTFAPIDLLDYIYAVLHSPSYRVKYKEFLKIDFPRVPAPLDHETFWKLVKLGGELRQIHLLESPIVENYITGYPEDGDNVVKKPSCKEGNVYINDTQYFSNVPEVAWNFYIGGYQPAQKWLKDRKDRELSYEDILHYQKIIVALTETDRIMKEIDLIEF